MEFVKEARYETDAPWRKVIEWEGNPLNVLIEAEILRIDSPLCPCDLCSRDVRDLENQKNDDECCVCRREDEEKLVLCDQCPRSFHQLCHLPHIDGSLLGDGIPWMCTFCVFTVSQQWRYCVEMEEKAVMSQDMSQHMLECQYLLLYLQSIDENQVFLTNPSLYLEDYTSVVRTPMWLRKIADNLQKDHYCTVGEFVSDVHFIFTNCASYNRNNAEFLTMSVRLKELFDKEFKKVFNIHGGAD